MFIVSLCLIGRETLPMISHQYGHLNKTCKWYKLTCQYGQEKSHKFLPSNEELQAIRQSMTAKKNNVCLFFLGMGPLICYLISSGQL